MVTAWSAINAKVFSASVEEQVILGSDGWLYYRETLDDYLGKGMSDEELEYAAKNLALMQEYAESQGAAFVFTIGICKSYIFVSDINDIKTAFFALYPPKRKRSAIMKHPEIGRAHV